MLPWETVLKKRHEGRERWIEIDGKRLLLRRPTGGAIAKTQASGEELIKISLVGWELTELDIMPGGTDQRAPFHIDLAMDWLEDNPEAYAKVVNEIIELINAYNKQLQDVGKK